MIQLPEDFVQKIINRYEDKGINWLKNIDKLIEEYTRIFQLKKIELAENLTMNIILFAKSDDYGDIVLKLGAPGEISKNEIKFIEYCRSEYMAKCYYNNTENRVTILERVKPGYSLENIESFDERVKIFCNIVNSFTKSNMPLEKFPSYDERLKEKIAKAKLNKNLSSDILGMLNEAYLMYNKINNMNLPKYVLHHDLQHKNILKSESGWKVIDPHGVVGERVFETCQFIKTELENKEISLEQISMIVEKVSKCLNEDSALIYKALYIETVSKIIFYIKSGYDENTILKNMNICKIILKYLT